MFSLGLYSSCNSSKFAHYWTNKVGSYLLFKGPESKTIKIAHMTKCFIYLIDCQVGLLQKGGARWELTRSKAILALSVLPHMKTGLTVEKCDYYYCAYTFVN